MKPFGIWEDSDIKVTGTHLMPYSANFSQCGENKYVEGNLTAFEGKATSYVLQPSSYFSYEDYVNKSTSGNPVIRMLSHHFSPNGTTKVELSNLDYLFETTRTERDAAQITPVADFSPGEYHVKVNGKDVGSIAIKLGGVYTLQTFVTANATKIDLTTITPANSVHILWLIPQYFVMTVGEVMFSVTGLEFAFTQAPLTMKSLLQAAWLMTVALGNLIVAIIAEAKIFDRQVREKPHLFFYIVLICWLFYHR